ncbi:hypothetical protein QQF64_000499 [Cirrhinus molitorella]|uniref:Uncharacterized protein n=1 Tax=Cirrhinus molitorella TaxID=172907 RepID=A0ABR3NXG5_9TELE
MSLVAKAHHVDARALMTSRRPTSLAQQRRRHDVTSLPANPRASSAALPRGRVTKRELRARVGSLIPRGEKEIKQ